MSRACGRRRGRLEVRPPVVPGQQLGDVDRLRRGFAPPVEADDRRAQRLAEQGGLRAEGVVDRRHRDAGLLGHRADRRAEVAVAAEQLVGRLHHPSTGGERAFGAGGSGGHRLDATGHLTIVRTIVSGTRPSGGSHEDPVRIHAGRRALQPAHRHRRTSRRRAATTCAGTPARSTAASSTRLGMPYFPYRRATEITGGNLNDLFPERAGLKGPKLISFDLEKFFVANVDNHFQDIVEIRSRVPVRRVLLRRSDVRREARRRGARRPRVRRRADHGACPTTRARRPSSVCARPAPSWAGPCTASCGACSRAP